MATVKKTKAKENLAGRVELRIPRNSADEDPNVFISVNGKNFIVPRGQTVLVPPEIAEEYFRAEEAKESFITTIEDRKAKD